MIEGSTQLADLQLFLHGFFFECFDSRDVVNWSVVFLVTLSVENLGLNWCNLWLFHLAWAPENRCESRAKFLSTLHQGCQHGPISGGVVSWGVRSNYVSWQRRLVVYREHFT